jgi:hypothetical protein
MQCEEDAHCSGVREVRPCAADCVSTWTAMCHLSKEADGSGNGSSSGAVSLDEFQLISYCMEDKVPFQSNGENDYVCMRTSQVVTVTTCYASARSRTHLHPPPPPLLPPSLAACSRTPIMRIAMGCSQLAAPQIHRHRYDPSAPRLIRLRPYARLHRREALVMGDVLAPKCWPGWQVDPTSIRMEPESRVGFFNDSPCDKIAFALIIILSSFCAGAGGGRVGGGGGGGAGGAVLFPSPGNGELDLKETYTGKKIYVALYDGKTDNTVVLPSTNTT